MFGTIIPVMPFRPITPSSIFPWIIRLPLLVSLGWYLICTLSPPGSGGIVRDVSFPPGSGIRKLAQELETTGIIRSRLHFILMTRLRGQAHRLKAGDYRLNDGMTPGDIIRKISAGEVDYRRFALPEGYSIFQAAEILEQKGYFKRDEFLAVCRDRELLKRHGIHAESAEGYLHPATYNMTISGGVRELVEQMLKQSGEVHERMNIMNGSGSFKRHDILTLASIIEKEAVSPEEKPLISSVFHNRLRIGMPLQSDPTAVYGVRTFGGKVRAADLKRQTPYNTYLNRGLPPGPIGNPGSDAIQAALQPASSQYLYFVARQDGTHQFSRSLEEHNRAVATYLKRN